MAITVTVSYDHSLNQNYNIDNWAARGMKLVIGWIGMNTNATADGCVVNNWKSFFPASANIHGFILEPMSGYHAAFDHGSQSILIQNVGATSTSSFTNTPGVTETTISGFTSVPFLVWGT